MVKTEFINEENMEKTNSLNQLIIDLAPISIITIDKNGFITFANKYYKQISVNRSPLNKNIFKMPFFIREGLCLDYKKLLEDGTPFQKQNCASIDGSEYINIIAVPIKDENGEVTGAISMAVNVTETVRAKLQLAKLNAGLENKVAKKTKELLNINERLRESLQSRSQFISDASHELRTPLAIAKLNLEFFKKQFSQKDAESVKALNEIDNEIDKVSDILSDIAFFASIDQNSVEKMRIEKINLNKFLENLVQKTKTFSDAKNINVILMENESNPEIRGDKIKLERSFLSVIGNAIKYGKESGWVKIWSEHDYKNNSIKINIADNGIGIAKKDLPRIFERFYRTDLSKSEGGGGFGLGLATCKWIVGQHDGSVEVKSTFGKGSVFTIILPISR